MQWNIIHLVSTFLFKGENICPKKSRRELLSMIIVNYVAKIYDKVAAKKFLLSEILIPAFVALQKPKTFPIQF